MVRVLSCHGNTLKHTVWICQFHRPNIILVQHVQEVKSLETWSKVNF